MRYVLFFLLIIGSGVAQAQTSGRITFEEKMDLHKTLPPDRQEMKDMIPQYNTSKFEFIFNGNRSIYQPKKEEEITETSPNPQGGPMMMRMGGRSLRVVYKDADLDTMIDSRDFMQKQFLITGPLTARKWKIGAKQKEILGYNCMEASFKVDSVTSLVAWFSPQLPVSNGPADYQGLPGMILQVDINDGQRMITATEIVLENVDTTMIEAPTKGKEVTAEEFAKIREEKMKEMGIQHGPGGGQQMIMIRN